MFAATLGAWGPPPPPPNAVAEHGGPKSLNTPRLSLQRRTHALGSRANLGAWPCWALHGPPQAPGVAANTPNFFQPPTSGQRARTPTQGGGWRPWRQGLLASNAPRVNTGLILQQCPQKLHPQAPGVVENVPVAFCRAGHLPTKMAVGHPPGAGHGPGGRSNFKFGPQFCKPQAPGVAAKGATGLVWWARPILCPFARICWPASGQGGPLAPFGQIWRPKGHSCPPSGPQAPQK